MFLSLNRVFCTTCKQLPPPPFFKQLLAGTNTKRFFFNIFVPGTACIYPFIVTALSHQELKLEGQEEVTGQTDLLHKTENKCQCPITDSESKNYNKGTKINYRYLVLG